MKRKTVLKHVGQILITILGVAFITFSLMYLAPGDPVSTMLRAGEMSISQTLIDQTRAELGLDKPFLVQFGSWLLHAVQGDLGKSFFTHQTVVHELGNAFHGTLLLALTSLVITVVITLPIGFLAAIKQNTVIDYIIRGFCFLGISMPTFWIGLVILYIFGLKLGLIPIGTADLSLTGVIAPATTLAIGLSSKYIRQVRLMAIDELNKDYVVGAICRGIPFKRVILFHVLPNILLPLVTLLGMAVGWLLGGVAIIEIVFAWPGLGKLAVDAIMTRDYPLVQGFVLFISLMYMGINALTDFSYSYLDPRLRRR